MKKVTRNILGFVVSALLLSGCYINAPVQSNQVGIKLGDGVSITEVVGPGLHSDNGFLAKLETMDVSAKSYDWKDTSLFTANKQPIELALKIVVRRRNDEASVKLLWSTYRTEGTDDAALGAQVLSRVPSPAKAITTRYSLDEMLGIATSLQADGVAGREKVTEDIKGILAPELLTFGVELLSVQLVDIAVDADYLALVKAKANAAIEAEVAAANVLKKEQQLIEARKDTEIAIEKASRDRKVQEEQAQVYVNTPQLFELEKLKAMADIIKPGDKIIMVPSGTNITYMLADQLGNVKTIPVTPVTTTVPSAIATP